jgi:hypothetical protein
MGCPLSPYLQTHPDLSQVNIADFKAYPDALTQIQLMYTQIFKELIPEEAAQRHALDAFAAVFPVKDVYFSKKNLEGNILSYLKALLPFRETYRTLLTDTPLDQTSHIVVSDAQIQEQTTQTKLKTILSADPNHIVVLTVGNSANTVNAQGELSSQIVTDFVKDMGIKYLQLMNPRGNVKAIGNDFLFGCNSLTSVDTRGLTTVQSIGDSFIALCGCITSLDARNLASVRSIGTLFLIGYNMTTLLSNDLKRLEEVVAQINTKKKIGLADFQLILKD